MAYCTNTDVRLHTNLDTTDISDTDLTSLIADITAVINGDINTRVTRERILTIDNTRKNEIDGTNKIYYVRHWNGKFIADMDNDSTVDDTGDVIIYEVASDGTETQPTVNAVDSDQGKITMSSAPASGVQLYVTYEYCHVDPTTPDRRIKLACIYLAAAMSFQKINTGMSPSQVFGNVRLMRDMEAKNTFYKKYKEEIDKINVRAFVYNEAKVF